MTFDDGPEPGGTEAVLNALADAGATATFFVLVERAERYPHLIRAMMDGGHEIGLHGIDHRRLSRLPRREVAAQLEAGRARVEQLTGEPVRWFRPPYGAQLPATWIAARSVGLEPVLWGPTAWDWLELPVEELARRASQGLEQGAILLLHDGFAGDPNMLANPPAPTFDRGELAAAVLHGLSLRGLGGRSLRDATVTGQVRRWMWFRA